MPEVSAAEDIVRKRKLDSDDGDAVKRLRATDEEEEGREQMSKIQEVQAQLLEIDADMNKRILQIQQEASEKKKPMYQKRGECLKTIEAFWLTALCNSNLAEYISDVDQELLQYLDSVDVTHPDEQHVCIELMFSEDNPIIASPSIQRVMETAPDSSSIQVSCSDVDWKKDLTQEADEDGRPLLDSYTFLSWFLNEGCFEEDLMAEELYGTIWENPLHFFLGGDIDADIEAEEIDGANVAELDIEDNDDSLRGFADAGGDALGDAGNDDADELDVPADFGGEDHDEEEAEEDDGDDADAL